MTPTSDDMMARKKALRADIMRRRDALAPELRRAMSGRIAASAIELLKARGATTIAAFVAMRSEVDLADVVAWAHADGRAVALPAVTARDRMVFRAHPPGGRLEDGGFGTVIPPADAPEVTPDAILAPLLAFDRDGGRLGYGGGFYDRMIAGLRASGRSPLVAGVAFAAQEVDHVPREPHDMRLDLVITDQAVLTRG